MLHRILPLLLGSLAAAVGAEPAVWDTASDTWVATDALGRTLPGHDQVGGPRADRTVAMFYFLWHGSHVNGGPWDNSAILRRDPGAMNNAASPPWGPLNAFHHWGEPLFGYYVSDDAAVIRAHAQMLADAGVDVIVFDASNNLTYRHYYETLLDVFAEVRARGGHPPQVAFLCPFGNPGATFTELWRNLYAPGLHAESWFRWQGKPLILADPAQLSLDDRQRAFFTFRKPQPDYFAGPTQLDMWSWLEVSPQHVFKNAKGEKEMMSVGVAQNAVGGRLGSMSEAGAQGRSFHNGEQDRAPDAELHGLNFAEQWERALQEDPRLVFVTGWNEWIAMRLDSFNGVKQPVMFVDQFDQEHSRDIEPMRGGHGDDYYYQLVAAVRRYKGVHAAPPPCTRRTMRLDDLAAWKEVVPEYRDDIGDPIHRDHDGWNKASRYVDQSGRNDLVAAKVAWDDQTVWFQARTQAPITPRGDAHWMMLFIDADADAKTGWLGYDFVVDRIPPGATTATIERNLGGTYHWERVAEVPYHLAGDTLVLAIPRRVLGMPAGTATVDFKWADGIQETGEWSDFLLHGDVAPNGRFNYRARLSADR